MKVVGLDMESREYMKELNISLVPSFIHVWKRNYFVLLLSFDDQQEYKEDFSTQTLTSSLLKHDNLFK